LKLDGVLTLNGVNKEVIETLALLEPFGAGNPEPVFALRSVMVVYSAVVGENHIQCTLRSIDGATIKGIAFRALNTDVGDALLKHDGRTFHIAGKIRENSWQEKKNLQIIIEDVATMELY
jgi:single-stranded-DNA-specific exonuclease